MAKLVVSNFSCIEFAEIELGDLTILVGPQASGKSVLSKLIYFAIDVLSKQYIHIEDEHSIEEYRRALEQDFLKLFPAIAWGAGKFEISFDAGPYQLSIVGARRKGALKSARDKIKVQFSDYFASRYEALLSAWVERKQKISEKEKRSVPEFQQFWRIRANDQKI
jgi:hypothetical protein